jgi:heterodisulfide reductase subunit A
VAIRLLKRYVSDMAGPDARQIPDIEDRDEKIAVIGAGPAGLTAAYFLRLKGYQVTVFEASGQAGGMLRFGIPAYRLPRNVLDQEIQHILDHGIDLKLNTCLGKEVDLAGLKEQGFDAFYLSTGAHRSLKLGLEGEDTLSGVMDAVAFLRQINLGEDTSCHGNVLVVGGGNVAIDAARCARRIPGCEVTLVYRRTREQMPAYADEIQGALEEGITLLELAGPVRLEEDQGTLTQVVCLKNELGPPDASGRRRPVPVEGSKFVLPCDTLIPAIGQYPDDLGMDGLPGIEITGRNRIKVDGITFQTGEPGVFAGGDLVLGPATVVQAIGQGRAAADYIHEFIQNPARFDKGADTGLADTSATGPADTPGADWHTADKAASLSENRSEKRASNAFTSEPPGAIPRAEPAWMDPDQRIFGFDEVEACLTPDQALAEAGRCLNCGICCECKACVAACERDAINHDMKEKHYQIQVGSIILATGYDTLDPTAMTRFGYGRYPNVYTALEFERLSNATGPTGGQILMRDHDRTFTQPPKSVAIVHCVGSRDVNFHEYCSRVCCMYALKYTHLIKEKVGHDTKVYDFYIDMRCFGKGYEEFYNRCQQEGTVFIRGKVAQITHQPAAEGETEKLVAVAEDTLMGEVIEVPVDMVVLCTAIQARQDAGEIGHVLGLNQGADGFFLEEHPKLGPVNTSTEGVFLSGCCQKPMDIPDTVSQASGAAAKSLSLASRGQVEISPTVASIDPDICAGCQLCLVLCPYGAIEFDEDRQVSVVNEAVCKGCGSCSGACPSGAAVSRHFTRKQMFAEISGVLAEL